MSLTRREVRSLATALMQTRAPAHGGSRPANVDDLYYREIGGGYSGAFVALMWLEALPTIILKAGPSEQILLETRSRSQFHSPALESLRQLGLEGCSEPVEVDISGRDEQWRSMAYTYVGGLTYHDLERFADFGTLIGEVVHEESIPAASLSQLSRWIDRLCEQIRGRDVTEDPVRLTVAGIRAKPLIEYLPILRWDNGLEAALASAAAYSPNGEELLSLRGWWDERLSHHSPAPFPNRTWIHGDLNFGNALLDRINGIVELIDFGGAREGHVFQDLARFECELLFRVNPPALPRAGDPRSVEDRRASCLALAFGGSSTPLRDESDLGNPQLAVLNVLRATYDSHWLINQDSGRLWMYRWFLLCEILRRMMWTDPVSTQQSTRQAMLRSIVILKNAIDGASFIQGGFAAVADISRLLSCTAVYVPTAPYEASVNRQRNAAKAEALQVAAADGASVSLLAETGNAYLHFRGPFYPEVEALLERGTLRVVLVNPYFIDAIGISDAYADRKSLNSDGLHPLLVEKFRQSLAGYRKLAGSSPNKLEVRVAHYSIGFTTLITENEVFFEPYLRANRTNRHERVFDTFELRLSLSESSHVRRVFTEHFDFHWTNSTDLEVVTANADGYRRLHRLVRELWDQD